MRDPRGFFHLLGYLQYRMVVVAFYFLVQPLLKGSKGLSVHPKYLFGSYGNDLVFFWLSLGVAGL